ncbi:MAG: amidohydrolase [Bacteroidetes bacterium HGW-Bacteroidetes-17]|nr:MAG: amidohydrolase [Bacteroidetes bacterium HGW-Bacteroidetes-17]
MKKLISVILFLPILISCSQMKTQVDLIVFNSNIYTVDDGFSIAESFAVKDGKFVAVGTTQEILDKYSAQRSINGIGQYIYPGLIDAHAHFYGYGMSLLTNADLRGTKSPEEIVEILKTFHESHPAEWVIGRSWDQNDWEVKSFPTKDILDKAFPDNPVSLRRVDGHAAWVNSEALKRAGITAKTKVQGGEVILVNGEPSGVLIDNAISLVEKIITDPPAEVSAEALLEAQKNCFAVGLTSVVDCGLDYSTVMLIDELNKGGELKIRLNAMLSPTEENFENFVKNGPYVTDYLTVRSIKLYADGALGSRGALMIEPYADDPENKGLLMEDNDVYRKVCQLAYENNYQVCIHAIGDMGNRFSLNLFGEFLKEKNDRRWRIEHVQIIHPDDFELFGKYSIIPSIQPTHATSDMYWAGDRVGAERMNGAYAYKQLLATNGWVPSGTDFPVEEINPMYTFYAAAIRKDKSGYPENGFQMENALTREETLKSMTIWAAKGSFEEDKKGSIEVGKMADFIILEKDLMTTEEQHLPYMRVLSTFLAGDEVFKIKKD